MEKGAANLLKLRSKVDCSSLGEPSFLAVVTATGAAYRRKDGVYVVPITSLRE